MLAVPAAIACADVGDLDAARSHLTRAEGRPGDADELVALAGGLLFWAAGQDRDAERCALAPARVPR